MGETDFERVAMISKVLRCRCRRLGLRLRPVDELREWRCMVHGDLG